MNWPDFLNSWAGSSPQVSISPIRTGRLASAGVSTTSWLDQRPVMMPRAWAWSMTLAATRSTAVKPSPCW